LLSNHPLPFTNCVSQTTKQNKKNKKRKKKVGRNNESFCQEVLNVKALKSIDRLFKSTYFNTMDVENFNRLEMKYEI